MSRIPAVDLNAVEGETKNLLDAVHDGLGITPNLYRVAANSAAALDAIVKFNGALARGELRPRVREAIALTVAEANKCDYCLSAHTAIGQAVGLSDAGIVAAREATSSQAKLSAILAFTSAVVRNRAQIDNGDIAELKTAGVSNAEIVEIVANIALNVFTNYLNIIAGTEIDFPAMHAGAVA